MPLNSRSSLNGGYSTLRAKSNDPFDIESASISITAQTRVLLVGPCLSGGGAERRFTNIATNLFGGKADVSVLTIGEFTAPLLLDKVIDLGWSSRLSYPKSIWLLRRQIIQGQYDVLMSFGLFPNVIAIIASMLTPGKTRLIINEITRPNLEAHNNKGWRTLIQMGLRKWLYPRCSLITANSIDGLRETCELAGMPIDSGVRVVNAIDSRHLIKMSSAKTNISIGLKKYVICVGRLDFMKRIDTVVRAFHKLADRTGFGLVIVGDGEARQGLEVLVSNMGLKESVVFTGKLDNPFPLLKRASAFVLASEYEGFSNSVLEAMFCDVPVITSLCSSDASEMCDQGAALGFGVGNAAELSEHISAIMGDVSLGNQLTSCAREYCAPHEIRQAIPLYESLIRSVAGNVAYGCGSIKL